MTAESFGGEETACRLAEKKTLLVSCEERNKA